MLMEMAYRLAVEDSPFIEDIRKNMIVMITPALEVDGRDRMVDLYNYRKATPANRRRRCSTGASTSHTTTTATVLGLALALTRNQMRRFSTITRLCFTTCTNPCRISTR
jgi:hypothetical protein